MTRTFSISQLLPSVGMEPVSEYARLATSPPAIFGWILNLASQPSGTPTISVLTPVKGSVPAFTSLTMPL